MAIRPKDQNIMSSADRSRPTSSQRLSKSTMRARPSRRARRAWISGLFGVLMLGSGGCGLLTNGIGSALRDFDQCVDDSMIDYRNRAMAEKAWIRVRRQHYDHQYHRDIKAGFISGYMDVAGGGNGCPPTLAPESYWGWKYQSPYGQTIVDAWFQGYPYGAKAADQDGVGNWQSLRMDVRRPATNTGMYPVQPGMEPAAPNPFYSEDEIIPVPPQEVEINEPAFEELPSGEAIERAFEINDPDSVYYDATQDGLLNDPGAAQSVPDLEIASRPSGLSLNEPKAGNSEQEFSDDFVNELFGPPANDASGSGAEPLPFSFE